ncbi:MAG: oligosaccharide flippase family protein [Candidatus Margulisbacteria bacterium]|nr:oligosaccharide flippase family protein [Candidatus Margulisiibacteriota bacterium]MBU1617115.1 oligosaccharide flippase family protein [Candidatus Margulisiibacteriota bacterium]
MAISEKNIKNILIYAAPNFVGYLISVFTMPIMTRLLIPSDYGIIAMAGIFPAIALGVLTFGLSSATQRYYFEYYKDKKKLDALVISAQICLFVMFAFSIVPIYLFKDFIAERIIGSPVYGTAQFVCYLATFLAYMNNFYLLLYQNMQRAKEYAMYILMQMLITSFAGLIYIWFFKMSYMGPLYGSLTASVLVFLTLLFRFNREYVFRYDFGLLWESIKYGLQLVPQSFTGLISRFFDKYMLSSLLSLSAVGIYNIGQNIGQLLFTLMVAVWNSFQPVFFKEVFDNGPGAARSVGRMVTVFSYLTLAPIVLAVLFAKEIIFIMAPPSYSHAVPVIIIIACAYATNVFGCFVGLQYVYTKKTFLLFPLSIFGTIANVGFNLILIPKYGLAGGAASTFLSFLFINGVTTYVGQRLYKFEYEWLLLLLMYFNVFVPAGLLLYLPKINCPLQVIYLIKLVFLALFVFIGHRSNILTRSKFDMLMNMFLKKRNPKLAIKMPNRCNSCGPDNFELE